MGFRSSPNYHFFSRPLVAKALGLQSPAAGKRKKRHPRTSARPLMDVTRGVPAVKLVMARPQLSGPGAPPEVWASFTDAVWWAILVAFGARLKPAQRRQLAVELRQRPGRDYFCDAVKGDLDEFYVTAGPGGVSATRLADPGLYVALNVVVAAAEMDKALVEVRRLDPEFFARHYFQAGRPPGTSE